MTSSAPERPGPPEPSGRRPARADGEPASGPSESPGDSERSGRLEQLRWFGTLWVMGLAFHYTDSSPTSALPILLVGLPLLVFPSSLLAFAAVAVAAAVQTVRVLPAPANHQMLSLLVALGFGVAALVTAVHMLANRRHLERPDHPDHPDTAGSFAECWVDTARTPVGLTLLVVYAFTVFHKLNTAFFDPANSCAGTQLSRIAGLFGQGRVQFPAMVVQASAVGTVVVEVAILVCLALPGLRRWGLLLGVGFHSLLALASFYDFSTMVFAIYLLLVPPALLTGLGPRAARLRLIALSAFGVHMLVGLVSALPGLTALNWHPMLVATWYAAVLPLMVSVIRAAFAHRPAQPDPATAQPDPATAQPDAATAQPDAATAQPGPATAQPDAATAQPATAQPGPATARPDPDTAWPGWRVRPAVLLVVPLLAFVNGAAPYLGLKATASYSMFSNLQTEAGADNHLLPGVTALQLAPFLTETVTLTSVTLPDPGRYAARIGGAYDLDWLGWTKEKPPVVVPWLELRRLVAFWRDAGITGVRLEYVRGGVPTVVPDAAADPELAAPMPWWQSHLLAFRAIDSGSGPDICRW
ncbi:MAG: hypothetical protein ACT4O0_14715 [Pseudonocardia sp.]